MTVLNSLWSDVPTYQGGGVMRGDVLATSQTEGAGWAAAAKELMSLIRLRDDWNGPGSAAPRPDVLHSAFDIFRALHDNRSPAPSSVVASPNGSVVITWETATSYREAEIAEPYQISWMLEREERPTRHWEEDWSRLQRR
jgi:hypothetical protein